MENSTKVATSNATTIMAERMIDLLTNNTRIMDYVDSIGDIEVTTDFTLGWVEVKTDRFTITYFVEDEPNIKFEFGCEFNRIDLSDVIEMLDYDDEVNNIFHSVREKYV
jgi:hypothetical protein